MWCQSVALSDRCPECGSAWSVPRVWVYVAGAQSVGLCGWCPAWPLLPSVCRSLYLPWKSRGRAPDYASLLKGSGGERGVAGPWAGVGLLSQAVISGSV